MAVKLHRCSSMWVKIDGHPCWRVQKALDQAGVEYTVVKGPVRRSRRVELERLSGQRQYPVIEFEDGSIYREESKDMAARIRAGQLMEAHGADQAHGEHDHADHDHADHDHAAHDHADHDHDEGEHDHDAEAARPEPESADVPPPPEASSTPAAEA
jgi:glutaredoxin